MLLLCDYTATVLLRCYCVTTLLLCDYAVTVWLCCYCVTTLLLCYYTVTVWLRCYCVTTLLLCDYAVTVWLCCYCVTTLLLCYYAATVWLHYVESSFSVGPTLHSLSVRPLVNYPVRLAINYRSRQYCYTADGVLMACQSRDGMAVDLHAGLEFWTFYQRQSQGVNYLCADSLLC